MAIDSFTGEYFFLSNFSPAIVSLSDGFVYRTVEHAYQAAKTKTKGLRLAIRAAETPGQAKRLGRALILRERWEQMKVGVMLGLLRQKFVFGGSLAALLLATGSETLIEGNWWKDRFWGVCEGEGQNYLGKLLMHVRKELQRG